MKNFARSMTVLVSSVALVGASLMGAAGATAAPGDVSEIGLAAGSTPRDVAEGPDGNMWVTGGASNTIAKVTTAGAVTAYALPLPANVSNPWSIAAGPDGNMWFTLRSGGKIGRITTSGAVSLIDLPDASMQPQDITAGPDNNMWFTELGGRIGRVTMAGAVTMFTVPWANSRPHSIVSGASPQTQGLNFTDAGADRVGFIVIDGTIYGNVQLTAGSQPAGIANIDGSIWFAMTGSNKLGKTLPGTSGSFLETAVTGGPTDIASGVGNTMWISLSARNSVAKYSVQGAPLAEYPLTSPNSLPAGLAEGPDTNIWVAQTNAGKVARVLSGRVPVSTAAPAISPTTGVKAGSTLTASDGTWDYAAGSYLYQWQACSNGADTNSCTNISGATSKTYVATAGNTNQYLRVSVQGVNSSGAGTPAFSSLVGVATTPPPAPTPVTGGQTVTIAEGVTLTLKSAKRSRAGVKRSFAVIANTSNIKGKVRISIVDAAGRERQVVAKGRWLKPLGANTKRALKRKRISRSLSPGTYTVKAVFTPTPAFRDNYPVATMSKVITIRPPR
jgi:streptogramin lyase